MFLRLARFPLCTTKYRTLEVRLNGFRKQGNDVKVKHAENPKHEILNPKQITSTKLEIPNDYLKFVIWNLFRISIFGFRIYSDFKSAMTSSTEREEYPHLIHHAVNLDVIGIINQRLNDILQKLLILFHSRINLSF